MTVDNQNTFADRYQAGKIALERGDYRLSIENLEAASKLIAAASRQGGEVKLWLVTAYQAANRIDDAIALCEELVTHSSVTVRHKAQQVLYIIKAPKLNRPKEWMSEIPDLTNTDEDKSKYISAKKREKSQPITELPQPVDLSEVETEDNKFIWLALLLAAGIIGGLVFYS